MSQKTLRLVILLTLVPLIGVLAATLSLRVHAQAPAAVYRLYLPMVGLNMAPVWYNPARPPLVAQPNQYDFGEVDTGETMTETFVLANTSNLSLTVSSMVFDPAEPSFGLTPTVRLPLTLTGGARTTFSVAFTPQTEGDHRTVLRITTSVPQVVTVTVSLMGDGAPLGGVEIDDPAERDAYFHDIRTTGAISPTASLRIRAWDQIQALRNPPPIPGPAARPAAPEAPNVTQTFVWKSIGPHTVGTTGAGRVTAIAVDSAGVVYGGAALGGVFKSSDGGANWQSTMFHQPSLAVGSIAIDPASRLNVYVGTGEANNASDSYYGAGILKATDGGNLGDASWANYGRPQFVNVFGGANMGKGLVDPATPTRVFAATNQGFYRSTDSGVTWGRITAGIPAASVSDLVLNPNTSPVTLIAAVPGNGLYRSVDAGANWNALSAGLPAAGTIARVALAIAPSNPQIVYAGIQNSANSAPLGVWRTDDGGTNWGQINGMPAYCNFCWYANVLAVDPTNPNILFAGGLNLNRGTVTNSMGTYTWSNNPGAIGGLHADQHAIAFDPTNNNTVYAGNDGGLYKSTDAGLNFTRLDVGAITQHQGVALHPVLPNWTSSGAQDNGSMRYTGNTTTWDDVAGCDGGNTAVSQSLTAPNEVYITTQSNACGRILRADSITGGFSNKTNGITIAPAPNNRPDGSSLFYPPLVIDPNNPSTLYFGSTFIYRTTDRADNWAKFPSAPTQSLGANIATITVAPTNSTTVYAGTTNGTLWRTTTASPANWVELTDISSPCSAGATCLPGRVATRIAVHPTDANRIYVTFGSFAAGGRQGHVFRSSTIAANGATTWTDITPLDRFGNQIDLPVNVIAIDPNAPNRLFIGTDIGVMYSENDGTSWQSLDVQMPDVAILDLAINPSTGIVRAASHGRSMFDLQTEGPSLAIAKQVVTPANGTANLGSMVTYRITVTNAGTTNVTSLPLDDIYDSNVLRLVSANPQPSAVAPNLVEWDDLTGLPPRGTGRSLRPNETLIVTTTFQVSSCPTNAATLNKARVVGAIDENRAPVPVVSAGAALNVACASATLTKTRVGPERVANGELVSFDITIQNTGNIPLTTLPLTDTFDPAALTFVSATPPPNSTTPAGTLTWTNLGPLAAGASLTVRVTFRATGCPPGQTTTDTARVEGAIATGPAGPINLAPLVVTASVDIACPSIRVEKTLVPPAPGAITLGQSATFNIRITNIGNKIIRSLPLEDLFDPTHLEFDSATPLPSAIGYGHVQWTDLTATGAGGFGNDLAPGDSVTVTLRLRAIGCPPNQDTTDKAKVAGAIDEEGNPVATAEATATVKIACPKVAVSKVLANPNPCGIFGPGDPVQFSVTITNTGNSLLVLVPLVDTFDPTYLQFNSATPTPNSTAPPGTLTWTDLTGPAPNGFGVDLAPGATFIVQLNFTALASTSGLTGGETVNRVRVEGATDNYGFVAPTAIDEVGVAIRNADLYIEKVQKNTYPEVQVENAVPDTLGMAPFSAKLNNRVVVPGEIITYTVKYGNRGPDEATFVRILDVIPPGTIYLGHNLAPCLDHDIRVACYVGRVAPGEKRDFEVYVRVPNVTEGGFSTPPGTVLTDTISIASGFNESGPVCGTPDGTPANNTARYATTVLGDYGDAPSAAMAGLPGYGAQATGAYSGNYTREWLGRAVSGERSATDALDIDAEANLAPFNTDHHDDGVFYRNPFATSLPTSQRTYIPGERAVTARVTVSVADPNHGRYNVGADKRLYITSWADSNHNGVFGDLGDQIMFQWNGAPGTVGSDGGLWPANQPYRVMDLGIRVPGEIGWTMVRTRLSYGLPPTPGGTMDFGEIEDNLIGVFPGGSVPSLIPGPAQPRPPAP